jgi:hypothetical protein
MRMIVGEIPLKLVKQNDNERVDLITIEKSTSWSSTKTLLSDVVRL